jgi:hypothetical protein
MKVLEMGISLHMSHIKEPGRGGVIYQILTDSERALCKHSISLYGSSVKGTWREESYTQDYKRHVMEGSRNRAFLS